MAQSVRVEFVKLGAGGLAENVITGILGSAVTPAVTTTATAGANRPKAPGSTGFVTARLTALENPVFAAWGKDPAATLVNSIRLAVGVPECVVMEAGHLLSFVSEA